jgi:hypothetical protein
MARLEGFSLGPSGRQAITGSEGLLSKIGNSSQSSGKETMTISAQAKVNNLVPPETLVETNGAGSPYELGALERKPVLIVLGVTEIIEQESLHVSVWGSPDGEDWGQQALFWFPQKFYQGVAPAALDLRQLPGIKFLQARWEVNRWGRGDPRPMFKFGVEIQELALGPGAGSD